MHKTIIINSRYYFLWYLLIFAIFALALILVAHPARAQSAASTATAVDPNYWYHLVLSVVLLLLNGGVLAVLATWAKAHFDLQKGSAAANILDLLVTAGTQYGVSRVMAAPTDLPLVSVKQKAVGDFLNDLSASTQAAMKLKGVNAASIAQRIDGSLTMALAGVSSGAPSAPSLLAGSTPASVPAAK